MHNNILLVFLSPYISSSQHGFLPGRGTATAWYQIYSEVLSSDNIFEFDLRKYFDSINLDYLSDMLLKIGMDPKYVEAYVSWNRTAPESGEMPQSWETPIDEAQTYKYHVTRIWGCTGGISEVEFWLNRKRIAEKLNPNLKHAGYYKGVSQGSPISPALSTFLLNPLLLINPSFKVCQYADDGNAYGMKDPDSFSINFSPESGIRIHEGKSSWVKKHGYWLTPLKFLGKVFLPAFFHTTPITSGNHVYQGGIICNSTRTPKYYILSELDILAEAEEYDNSPASENDYLGHIKDPRWQEFFAGNWYNNDLKPRRTFDDWFKSKFFGYCVAAIYNGTFDLSTIQQDFSFRFEKYSWSDIETRRSRKLAKVIRNGRPATEALDTFNSSSIACQSLARRIKHFTQQTRKGTKNTSLPVKVNSSNKKRSSN